MTRRTSRPGLKGAESFGAGHRKAPGLRLAHGGGAPFTLLTLLLLLLGAQLSVQQGDPVSNFCRRFGHQAAIIDERLYINGGFINYNPLEEFPTNYTNKHLLFHDISTVAGSGMPQLHSNLTKNHSIPSANGAVLWPDPVNKRLYQFGGEFADTSPPPLQGLHAYDLLSDTWDHFTLSDKDRAASIRRTSYGAGVSIPERGGGYWYGGWLSNSSEEGWEGPRAATSYMIKYEMDTNRWTNTSGPDSVGRAEGAIVYIPAGDAGLLVYMGGVTDSGNGSVSWQPMDEILVYDVLSFKWYKQKASGDVPEERSRFCAGVTWAEDRSSYDIYLYGGASMPPSTAGFDDVYILSLPSFTWIKLYPDGHGTGEFPHHSLTCTVTSSLSQMLIIGGSFPLTDMCDTPEQWGVHNLDMGRQNQDGAVWMLYDPEKKGYVVPNDISDVIGGGEKGGATKTEPDGGFDSPDLEILLSRTASSSEREPTREISRENTGGNISRGAVVGIAVGSAVGLILLISGVAWLIWRRKRKAAPEYSANLDYSVPETQYPEIRDYVLPVPPQTDPIELAAEPPATPATYTPTPDSERGKEHWAGSPGGVGSVEEEAHELSATPGVGSGVNGERVHTTYYHA